MRYAHARDYVGRCPYDCCRIFPTHFSLQVNATALASPLSTDVTLVSHKVELSEDSSFANSESIGGLQVHCMIRSLTPATECSIEGFTPIAGQLPPAPLPHPSFLSVFPGNTINVNPDTGVVQMDCKGLTLGRFYYVRMF